MSLPDDKNEDDFDVSGPTHMMAAQTGIEIDWGDEEHRRCIMACLVKGTYVMESDRTKEMEDTDDALAPAWWERFHFRRRCVLEFECKCVFCKTGRRIFEGGGRWFIYGAVFEYAPPDGLRHPSAPSYVVAFRGTMLWYHTFFHDVRHDVRILLNMQHVCRRFLHGREMVGQLLSSISIPNDGGGAGSSVVWLAGHSLGASIALDVGRHMMIDRELNLPTFLFNPPHVSLAAVIGEAVKSDVYTMGYLGRYALGKVLTSHKDRMEELFQKLEPWEPNLYVHEGDIICKGFIDYFEQREVMKEWIPGMAKSAATLSFRDMAHSLFGKHNKERPHLIPSAVVWKNQREDDNAHGLGQWWQKLVLIQKRYTWRVEEDGRDSL